MEFFEMTKHTEVPTEILRKKQNGQACLAISPELAEKLHPGDTIVFNGNLGTFICTRRVFQITYVGEVINNIEIWVERIIDTPS
jgi:hypothetical protein